MLKSIKRSIKLINKDEFDTALFKATFEDNTNKPKDKHLKVIELCLYGEDKKILPLDAFSRFNDQIVKLNFTKWVYSLKYCYILHHCLFVQLSHTSKNIKTNCKLFIEAMCSNNVFKRIKQNQTSSPKELHQSLTANYFNYLHNRYESYLYFQNALEDLDQKEESQKVLIIHKLLQQINILIKMHKELDLLLENFPNCQIVQEITYLIVLDLQDQYPKVYQFISQRVDHLTTVEANLGLKLYNLYTDTLRISRGVKQLNQLKSLLTGALSSKLQDIKVFQIEPERNKEIELYYKKFQPTNQATSPNKHSHADTMQFNEEIMNHKYKHNNADIIQFDEEITIHRDNQMSHESSDDGKNSPKEQLFLNLKRIDKPKKETEPQVVTAKQLEIMENSFDPKPDEIRKSPLKAKTSRQNLERKRLEQNDAASYFTTTTQQSFVTNSDVGEARIMGLNRTESIQSSISNQKEGFFNNKQSPLSFLQFESYTPGVQVNRKAK